MTKKKTNLRCAGAAVASDPAESSRSGLTCGCEVGRLGALPLPAPLPAAPLASTFTDGADVRLETSGACSVGEVSTSREVGGDALGDRGGVRVDGGDC